MSKLLTAGEELQDYLEWEQAQTPEPEVTSGIPKAELVYYGGHVGVLGAEHFDVSPDEAGWAD
jgi:hypothetical protein